MRNKKRIVLGSSFFIIAVMTIGLVRYCNTRQNTDREPMPVMEQYSDSECIKFTTDSNTGELPASLTFEEQLLSQIKKESDDCIASMGDDWKDTLSLQSIYYGSFTKDHASEMAAVIKIDAPHVGGLDRKIIAVYDAAKKTLITQKTISGDHVEIYWFKDAKNKSSLLSIAETTNQGITSSRLELDEINENEWSVKTLPEVAQEEENLYGVSGERYLHVFQQSNKTEFHSVQTLMWDASSGNFR